MTIDRELLGKTQEQQARLADAERQVLVARAEYHTGVRRLHLGGASLRELADALGLSHQRVQQIVQGAGGSWWRRAWRTRNNPRDAVCTWCGRPPSEVAKLVAGPNVFICDGCLAACERTLAARTPASTTHHRTRGGVRGRCTFCSRRAGPSRTIVTGPAASICDDCMRISRQFMNGAA